MSLGLTMSVWFPVFLEVSLLLSFLCHPENKVVMGTRGEPWSYSDLLSTLDEILKIVCVLNFLISNVR